MRHASHGTQGTPNLRQLAASLKVAQERQDPILKHVREMGLAAKSKGMLKVVKRKGSHFGFTGQQLKRMRLKSARQRLWEQTKALPMEKRALALANDTHVSHDMQALLATARSQVHLDGMAKKQDQQLRDDSLKSFASGIGRDRLQRLFSALPGLKPLVGSSIQAIPVVKSSDFWLPACMSEDVCKGLSGTSTNRSSNLNSSLEKEWRECHAAIKEEMCAALPSDIPSMPRCRKLGCCVCGANGKSLYKLRNQFFKSIKNKFSSKEQKQKLLKAEVVFLISSDEDCEHGWGQPTSYHWYHIAAMSLSPYEPTMHLLKPCHDHVEEQCLERRYVLEVLHVFAKAFFSLATCSLLATVLGLAKSQSLGT